METAHCSTMNNQLLPTSSVSLNFQQADVLTEKFIMPMPSINPAIPRIYEGILPLLTMN